MRNTHGRRLATAMGAAAALVALTATGAQAAAPSAAPEKVTHTGTVAPTSQSSGSGGGSLVQGWQFCLLASCETHAGSGGAQGVQGINFCLLAFCSVRG
ncbi:hypothetical protein [Streptomyces spiramenti]|uniref:Secreted protein n=1 Tax=Streptomyces spiramenti TaxID=2720606 RepID=A0ABX1AIF5_9ACTN|nr:hypothetical protein [Streptomyces spiramenti]NJP66938.1 hypothetical protein [Streptomyces spiramenti]